MALLGHNELIMYCYFPALESLQVEILKELLNNRDQNKVWDYFEIALCHCVLKSLL